VGRHFRVWIRLLRAGPLPNARRFAASRRGRPGHGHWVAKASLQPGDLVFFGTSASNIHHVAIYAGAGTILETPQTGYPVRLIPLSTYADYFTGRHLLP